MLLVYHCLYNANRYILKIFYTGVFHSDYSYHSPKGQKYNKSFIKVIHTRKGWVNNDNFHVGCELLFLTILQKMKTNKLRTCTAVFVLLQMKKLPVRAVLFLQGIKVWLILWVWRAEGVFPSSSHLFFSAGCFPTTVAIDELCQLIDQGG